SRDGQLNLDRALPAASVAEERSAPTPSDPGAVMTAKELAAVERENLRRALEATGWRVAGESGAARLLGMAPSTLTSRMKSLGIRRTR
ncbi:MAG TPA: helix-turn-helix domain-containing protein, partial [Myxococcaceae bacterium]|nr:helix-turn-helix domain-containing protein [Myxococcaceae bacterium]